MRNHDICPGKMSSVQTTWRKTSNWHLCMKHQVRIMSSSIKDDTRSGNISLVLKALPQSRFSQHQLRGPTVHIHSATVKRTNSSYSLSNSLEDQHSHSLSNSSEDQQFIFTHITPICFTLVHNVFQIMEIFTISRQLYLYLTLSRPISQYIVPPKKAAISQDRTDAKKEVK